MSFTRQPCPVWLFVDLDGNILDDTYYAFFLENTIPYLPQPVYQDPQGMIPWSNPLEFYANGTLPDNLYFAEGETYRIEIRKGNTQQDPLIYLIENFVPNGGSSPSTLAIQTSNQITNPQFAFVSFTNDYVIVNSGTNTYNIAPGWSLILEGSATMTLSQLTFTGSENFPGNPSFGLRLNVTSGTFTSVKLYQRFDHIPAIFASEGISITLIGRSNDATRAFSVVYAPSDGAQPTIISDSFIQGTFNLISGAAILDPSTSTDDGLNGYVDILFNLPVQGSYDLSNIQVIGSAEALDYSYEQTTVERQTDNTFHYYADSLIMSPKTSILTGWNFSLNPYQFTASGLQAVVSQASYIADQTILIQEGNNNLSYDNGRADQRYTLQITPTGSAVNTRFVLIQYIDPATILPYWSYILSALARMKLNTVVGSQIHVKMRLIYRSSLPPTIGATEPVASWPLGQDPIFSSGWTAIAPLNDPSYLLNSSYNPFESGNAFYAYPFDGFKMPNNANNTMTLGVAIYTMERMAVSASPPDSVAFDKVSVSQNDFAIDAQPQTFDQVLKECQYYYEKSYNPGVLPGTVTPNGQRFEPAQYAIGGTVAQLARKSFNLTYNTIKRENPVVTFYSPTSATANRAMLQLMDVGVNVGNSPQLVDTVNSYTPFSSVKDILMTPSVGGNVVTFNTLTVNTEARIVYHFSADSRLGK